VRKAADPIALFLTDRLEPNSKLPRIEVAQFDAWHKARSENDDPNA
jgi:hypothetical protein